jgi:prevent-host-death family protein
MAKAIRRSGTRRVPLSEIQDDLARFLREAKDEEIVITRNGKPAAVLIGFMSEKDRLDYQLGTDTRFLRRVERARKSLKAGRGVPIEDVQGKYDAGSVIHLADCAAPLARSRRALA